MNKRNKKKKTIGELTQSRATWGIDASTKVIPNKKGKGSYSRHEKNPLSHTNR